ncbi:MAG: hypothetical protein ACLTSC_00835 [Mediterraneibacter faecis]
MIAIADLKAIVDREFDAVDNRSREYVWSDRYTYIQRNTQRQKGKRTQGRPGFGK